MNIQDIALHNLREAPWNPNIMDEAMLLKLKKSISQFGLVENLVVRPVGEGVYEVLSGNQRFKVLKDMKITEAPCVVVELNDSEARLLAQALNRIQGEDDLGKKADLMNEIIKTIPAKDIFELLPESNESLQSLASLGNLDISGYLENWDRERSKRLKHMPFQLTGDQYQTVEQALLLVKEKAKQLKDINPNIKGNSLYLICEHFLERESNDGKQN